MNTTATISISNKNLSCSDVVHHLYRLGIFASVTENVSIVKDGDGCSIEHGCRIVTTVQEKQDVRNIWNGLKKDFQLGCSNVKIDGGFNGCINHYLKEYECG